MRTIQSFFRLFFIGGCALTLLTQTRLLLHLPLTPVWLDGFVFGGAIFGYHCTHPDRRYRAVAWVFGVAGGVCCILWMRDGGNVVAAFVPVLSWLAYYGFRRPGNAGLRSRPLAKPLTIAFVWAWVTVLLPVSMDYRIDVLVMFLARGAFIFALALAYDVSDMGYDLRHGLVTLAQRLHTKGTLVLIQLGMAVSGICVCIRLASGLYTLQEALALLLSLVFSAWWVRFVLKKEHWHPWHKVLIDALMPLQCALVLLLH